jgi:hypothetical protein
MRVGWESLHKPALSEAIGKKRETFDKGVPALRAHGRAHTVKMINRAL